MPFFISYEPMEPPVSIVHAAPGAQMHLNSSFANFLEFQRTGFLTRGAIGALGSFEMNMSWNMDYSGPAHRLYDQTKPAYWTALGGGGYHLQYAPATFADGDVWDIGGRQIAYSFDIERARFNGSVEPFRPGVSDLGAPGAGFRRIFIDSAQAKYAGDVTMNKSAGRLFANAGQATITLRNSHCTDGAMAFANVASADPAAYVRSVLSSAGYCTINLGAVPQKTTAINFFVISAN